MKTKILSICALTAILFASCNSDDNETPEINDGRVKFSAGVNTASLSRISGDDSDRWEGNETIGIYMLSNHDQSFIDKSKNIPYVNKLTGPHAYFNNATPSIIYYPVDITKKVGFLAYHPYNKDVVDFAYPIDLSNQRNQSDIDLITVWDNNLTNGYDKTNTNDINLQFVHRLTKIVIKVKDQGGVGDLSGLTVKIKGMNTTAQFNLSNSIISNEAGQVDIVPYNSAPNVYEAILLPKSLTANDIVTFELNNDTYSWSIKENASAIALLKGGAKYTFNVGIEKKKLALVNCTIEKWDSKESSTGVAK